MTMTGLVLCGGESTRMGRDKALLSISGRPLFVFVAETLRRVCDPVVLAPGCRGRLGITGFQEVDDAVPDTGPMGGIAAGLAASSHDLVAVVAVDMPRLSPALLQYMAVLHSDEDAIVPITSRGREPLHAVYARSSLAHMRGALEEGRLGMRALLDEIKVKEVGEPEWSGFDPSGAFAANVNTMKDLESELFDSSG